MLKLECKRKDILGIVPRPTLFWFALPIRHVTPVLVPDPLPWQVLSSLPLQLSSCSLEEPKLPNSWPCMVPW